MCTIEFVLNCAFGPRPSQRGAAGTGPRRHREIVYLFLYRKIYVPNRSIKVRNKVTNEHIAYYVSVLNQKSFINLYFYKGDKI